METRTRLREKTLVRGLLVRKRMQRCWVFIAFAFHADSWVLGFDHHIIAFRGCTMAVQGMSLYSHITLKPGVRPCQLHAFFTGLHCHAFSCHLSDTKKSPHCFCTVGNLHQPGGSSPCGLQLRVQPCLLETGLDPLPQAGRDSGLNTSLAGKMLLLTMLFEQRKEAGCLYPKSRSDRLLVCESHIHFSRLGPETATDV